MFYGTRGSGKTYQTCKIAKEIGAIVMCANAVQANRIKEEYGVETMSIHQAPDALLGRDVSVIWDHFASEARDHRFGGMMSNCTIESKLRNKYEIWTEIKVTLKPDFPLSECGLTPGEIQMIEDRIKAKLDILIEGFLEGLKANEGVG